MPPSRVARHRDAAPSGYQAPRCVCGHTSGQHRVIATAVAVQIGVCLTRCGCRRFDETAAVAA